MLKWNTLDYQDILTGCGLLYFFNICMSLMIGWAISMVVSCGKFDTAKYIEDVMQSHNCTNVFSFECGDVQTHARSDAQSIAFEWCFYYCKPAVIWSTVGTTCFLLILFVHINPTWRKHITHFIVAVKKCVAYTCIRVRSIRMNRRESVGDTTSTYFPLS